MLVVRARAAPAGVADFDLAVFGANVTVHVSSAGRERILLSDGLGRLCLDVRSGSLLEGPVRLELIVGDIRRSPLAFGSLQRLVESVRLGAIAPRPLLSPGRSVRWVDALRARDARSCGASQREIAVLLFGARRVECDWAGPSDSLRSRVRRMLAHADRMVMGGWRDLLGGKGV